jgi:hypothetical protein
MTEDTPYNETAAAPVIDQEAAIKARMASQQAKEESEHKKMLAEMAQRRKQEAEIAAVQDLALKNIRERCEAELAAFARSQVEATDA